MSGRVVAGITGDGMCGGRATFLFTESTTEGVTDANLDFICQTELKFASVLQVVNSSS